MESSFGVNCSNRYTYTFKEARDKLQKITQRCQFGYWRIGCLEIFGLKMRELG